MEGFGSVRGFERFGINYKPPWRKALFGIGTDLEWINFGDRERPFIKRSSKWGYPCAGGAS
jgi:hypothetical protein